MAVLNRSALGVTARQPLRDWALALEGGEGTPWQQEDDEPSLYLIPSTDTPAELAQVLEQCWSAIFDAELESWCPDLSLWPPHRDFALFNQWFSWRFYPLVEDLGGGIPMALEPLDPGLMELVAEGLRQPG